MKISQKEDFAIILMSTLAKNYSEKFISLSFIARETGLSPLFLKHIAVSLKNYGLILSREGVSGGYRLAKKPQKISAAEILQAISDHVVTLSCAKGECRLNKRTCVCFSFWGKLNYKMGAFLGKIKLSEIMKT